MHPAVADVRSIAEGEYEEEEDQIEPKAVGYVSSDIIGAVFTAAVGWFSGVHIPSCRMKRKCQLRFVYTGLLKYV